MLGTVTYIQKALMPNVIAKVSLPSSDLVTRHAHLHTLSDIEPWHVEMATRMQRTLVDSTLAFVTEASSFTMQHDLRRKMMTVLCQDRTCRVPNHLKTRQCVCTELSERHTAAETPRHNANTLSEDSSRRRCGSCGFYGTEQQAARPITGGNMVAGRHSSNYDVTARRRTVFPTPPPPQPLPATFAAALRAASR